MKAILDHIGIAVGDIAAAVAFYRDALGLEIEAPEEVASQRVRAHFVPVGDARLELLEPTAADSPIAKFNDKRGPGLHHITLRVEDIEAAVTQLKARGVRMIDEHPRPGAEHSTIAFVHPSATNGVLVELKQSSGASHQPPVGRQSTVKCQRYKVGDLELIALSVGTYRLDGGALFGTVPRPRWSRHLTPDAENRVTLGLRAVVVRGARTMLVGAGIGDLPDEAFRGEYGVEQRWTVEEALADAGLAPHDIDIVLASHLHVDHAGGFTVRDADGRLRPRFPRAQYVVRRGEWEDANRPDERSRASYRAESFAPLAEAGVLQLVDADQTIMPGVRVQQTGGHTRHHQLIAIESQGGAAALPSALMPTIAHAPDAWIMGYDLYPADTLAAKQRFVADAIARGTLVFFEHDPTIAAGYLREEGGARRVEPAPHD